MPTPLRMAVIGGGEAATKALSSLKGNGVATIAAAVCEPHELIDIIDPAIRATDVRNIMERSDVELIYVATPTGTHVELASQAIAARKNVLIEKPLAVSVQDAAPLMDIAASTDNVIAVGFKKHYSVALVELAHSEIVKYRDTRATYIWHNPLPSTPWRFDLAQSGGGVLMDLGSHVFALFEYLFGPMEKVFAKLNWMTSRAGIDDYAVVDMVFKSGNTACAELSWRPEDGCRQKIVLEHGGESVIIQRTGGPEDIMRIRKDGELFERPIEPKYEYIHMFENLRRCIRSGTGVVSSLNDGYRNLIIIDAIKRSAYENKPVWIS